MVNHMFFFRVSQIATIGRKFSQEIEINCKEEAINCKERASRWKIEATYIAVVWGRIQRKDRANRWRLERSCFED